MFEKDMEAVITSLACLRDCNDTVMDIWLDFALRQDTLCKWEARSTLSWRMDTLGWDLHGHRFVLQQRVQSQVYKHVVSLLDLSVLHPFNKPDLLSEQMGQ